MDHSKDNKVEVDGEPKLPSIPESSGLDLARCSSSASAFEKHKVEDEDEFISTDDELIVPQPLPLTRCLSAFNEVEVEDPIGDSNILMLQKPTIPIMEQFFKEDSIRELQGVNFDLNEIKLHTLFFKNGNREWFKEIKDVFYVPYPDDNGVIRVGIVDPDHDKSDLHRGTPIVPLTEYFPHAPETWLKFLSDGGFNKYTALFKELEKPPLHMKKFEVQLKNGTTLCIKVHMLTPYINSPDAPGEKVIDNDMLIDDQNFPIFTVELFGGMAKVTNLFTKKPVLVPSSPMVAAKNADLGKLKPLLRSAHYTFEPMSIEMTI